jgi:preprotein translocase subunit SecY
MASAAEQLMRNLNFEAFGKADELKKRIWFTLGALLVYRLGTHIPLPGIDPAQIAKLFEGGATGILGMFNMFSGGSVSRMAIFLLGIMPYISASIIIQLLTNVIPQLEVLKKEGEAGRKKINQYTRYFTVLLALAQGYGTAVGLQVNGLATDPGMFFLISTTITLVGGTMFLMWLGEQITARGVGNGISLIIFAGIAADMPNALIRMLASGSSGALSWWVMPFVLLVAIALIALIVFFERAQRRLLVQYPKRQLGNRLAQGDSSHLPLKLNTAGVIPPIFASSLLLLPSTTASLLSRNGQSSNDTLNYINAQLGQGQPLHILLYVGLIVFFCFFYTAIVFDTKETADNLKKYGGFMPGIRPGEKTASYLDYILARITVLGAAYLAFVCVLPEVFSADAGIPVYLGGTSLLIAVSVTMDTVAQIQSHLLAHQYEGLIKKAKLKGSTVGRRG